LFLPFSEVYRYREYYLDREVSLQGWLAIGGDFYPDYVIASYAYLTTLEEGGDAWDRAQTLASLDRIKKLAANLKATVIIQHDMRDIGKLPAFPAAAR